MFSTRHWIADGGLASTLQDLGYAVDGDPLWSARLLATEPNAIKRVHKTFLEANAEMVTTASYQASIPGFVKHLNITDDEAVKLMTLSVSLAREAVDEYSKEKKGEKPLVVGSIGPYGACQADGSEYTGDYISQMTEEELRVWHRPRMTALVDAGVDLLAIETIPALMEAIAVLKLIKKFPGVKAWVTFSCRDGQSTNHGDHFGEAVRQCYEEAPDQLVAVGVNCSPPQHVSSLLKEANLTLPAPEVLPRVVYPNSGEQWVAGKGWEGRSAEWSYVTEVPSWLRLGARVVGGCCRIGPADVKDIASVVAKFSSS
ncbi:homocysteine S-methyltransferase YbgG-like isoform X2 [Penaeus japonicus]|nr:homocysteine S-methyltransferase YbgG-like isoform X2 [Penaeus japonicus]XP_042872662.1 homocysteine S-methyltransferase YbgG-like isoform X2 [Penaeus japonicus]XP_042872663.1 homocysteine S-methyltransferase YbgG-like isoform X2 [Penaeus japonicus]XP_042872664.1 homocysteine S-methyltransferase YbgG-like isoform X2 [Penaeus japonicus]